MTTSTARWVDLNPSSLFDLALRLCTSMILVFLRKRLAILMCTPLYRRMSKAESMQILYGLHYMSSFTASEALSEPQIVARSWARKKTASPGVLP
jgi:hypothetical protein